MWPLLGERASLSPAPVVLASGRLQGGVVLMLALEEAETPAGPRARRPLPLLSLPPDSASSCPHLSSCRQGSNGPLRHWPLTLWGLGLLDWMRALARVLGKAAPTLGRAARTPGGSRAAEVGSPPLLLDCAHPQ